MVRIRYAAVFAAVLFLAACTTDKSSNATSAAPAQDQSWAPARLTSVEGVPSPAIEAALKKMLAGSPPAKIDDHQWAHTKHLYNAYGNNPLWLAPDGLHKDRTFALTNSVLQAEQDGMRMDAYPIATLA